jgi:hypothetical protein
MHRVVSSPSVLLMLATVCAAACSTPSNEDVASGSESELRLEQAPISTSLAELRAGQPYVPGIDEAPIAVGAPCVVNPKLAISGGQVSSSAAVVQTRESLSRELGFDVNGTIPVAGGLTGAAGLSANTNFDSRSAVVLFQSTGTYESSLSGADQLPAFDTRSVSRCGYGYITRAMHRVTSALVVSVRSTDNGSTVRGNAGLGKSGIAEAKLNLSSIISRGRVEISLRFATDVIPKLPRAPFADAVLVVGDNAEDKAKAIQKLDKALDWLAGAQSAIETYLLDLRARPDAASPAPTQNIRFRFYPSTPQAVRTAIEQATVNAIATRTALGEASALADDWQQFANAVRDNRAYEWNIPNAPVSTVDELQTKRRVLLEDKGGQLKSHQTLLEDSLDACVEALRNDAGLPDAELRTTLAGACKAAPALPVDRRVNDVAPIAAISVQETVSTSRRCPEGQRLPTEAEVKIFAAWSRNRRAIDQGLWIEDGHCTFSEAWLWDGKPDCTPFASTKKGLSICLSRDGGPFPVE